MIGFLGISHLSLCYAASILKLNKKVIIFDIKKEILNYNSGLTKIFEPGLDSNSKEKII